MNNFGSVIKRLGSGLGILLAIAGAAPTFALCKFDDFPVMDDMNLYPILSNAVHNNRPMMVKGFTSDQAMKQVIGYYHRTWEGRVSDSVFAKWNQVSTLTDECLMTVQIAPNGDESQGRLVISNVPTMEPSAALGQGLIKPVGSVVVSDLITNDGHKTGRVSLLACSGSPDELADFYRSNMANDGWQLQRDFQKDEARVLVFRDGLNVSNILIIPANGMTQVLINSEEIQ